MGIEDVMNGGSILLLILIIRSYFLLGKRFFLINLMLFLAYSIYGYWSLYFNSKSDSGSAWSGLILVATGIHLFVILLVFAVQYYKKGGLNSEKEID